MNERIRKLAEYAEEYADFYAAIADELEKDIFVRRFAELLILECAPFVGDPDSEAVEKMMKHFGVNDESSRRNKRGLV